jgi:hypothetical protein
MIDFLKSAAMGMKKNSIITEVSVYFITFDLELRFDYRREYFLVHVVRNILYSTRK